MMVTLLRLPNCRGLWAPALALFAFANAVCFAQIDPPKIFLCEYVTTTNVLVYSPPFALESNPNVSVPLLFDQALVDGGLFTLDKGDGSSSFKSLQDGGVITGGACNPFQSVQEATTSNDSDVKAWKAQGHAVLAADVVPTGAVRLTVVGGAGHRNEADLAASGPAVPPSKPTMTTKLNGQASAVSSPADSTTTSASPLTCDPLDVSRFVSVSSRFLPENDSREGAAAFCKRPVAADVWNKTKDSVVCALAFHHGGQFTRFGGLGSIGPGQRGDVSNDHLGFTTCNADSSAVRYFCYVDSSNGDGASQGGACAARAQKKWSPTK